MLARLPRAASRLRTEAYVKVLHRSDTLARQGPKMVFQRRTQNCIILAIEISSRWVRMGFFGVNL